MSGSMTSQSTSESLPTSTGASESAMTEDGSVSGAGESWASEFTSSAEVTPSTVESELPQTSEPDNTPEPNSHVSLEDFHQGDN